MMYDEQTKTLRYYKLLLWADDNVMDTSYHTTFENAVNRGEKWCDTVDYEERDYDVIEKEIDFTD